MPDNPTPEDERIEVDLEDDETPTDPVDEPEGEPESEDPEGADESGGEPAEAAPPAPKGDRSIGRLREERRTLAEENARLTRQLDEIRRQPPAQPVETPQQRADRLALLAPEDRLREEFNERISNLTNQFQQTSRQQADANDRAHYRNIAAREPLAVKLEAEVERLLADMRRTGHDAPREVLYEVLVGRRARAQMGKGAAKAAANRERQQARPVSPRGDVRADRSRRGTDTVSDIEARFGDVPI